MRAAPLHESSGKACAASEHATYWKFRAPSGKGIAAWIKPGISGQMLQTQMIYGWSGRTPLDLKLYAGSPVFFSAVLMGD